MAPPLRHAALLTLCTALFAANALAEPLPSSFREPLRLLEPLSRTGVIYDRVLPLARLERYDGSASAPVADLATWRQAYDELQRASLAPAGPELAAITAGARAAQREGVIPLAVIDRAFEHVRPGAVDDGAVRVEGGRLQPVRGDVLAASRAVVAAALTPRTYRGADVTFALDPERCFSSDGPSPTTLAIDFADGRGFRPVALGERVRVHYRAPGARELRLRLTRTDGSVAEARAAFDVAALVSPTPDDTLHITATIPFASQYGTGDAYVYLAPNHATLTNPIVVVEGFDLDNSMNWDELYMLLNQESLIETLRADGFDAVVLNFTDATVAIEQNGFVVEALVSEVQSLIPAANTLAVVGASMGGLCSRYALAYMESHAISHRVRTWLSFDAPHTGADIPLGLQYWINFFSGQSADAAAFLAILDRPAAREQLLYHYTTPPTATGVPDPMRAQMLSAFTAAGDYPTQPRLVAIANGSGGGDNQGFAPGAQVIQWNYSSAFVAITGNVWAVPNVTSTMIFQGSLRIFISTTTQNVTVSGTAPWDGAPGGARASFAELDAIPAPYGDIVAPHPSHCFIPSVSALALPTGNPFFPIAGTPGVPSLTPFDAIYYPFVNQGHVAITPENAAWIRAELEQGVVGVEPGGQPPFGVSFAAGPNPLRDAARITYALPRAMHVDLRVFDVSGREVRALVSGPRPAGEHTTEWDGRDARGDRTGTGVFFVRLAADGGSVVRRIVRLD